MCSKTILVLDSDVQRRTQIRYVLSQDGYKVLEATNPQHAESISSVREIPIDLVIRDALAESDFSWPEWRPWAPVLLLTTLSRSRIQNSPDDFWRIPFDPEQLLSEVRSALAQDRNSERCRH
jgi:DNA-binding response OmpR family regulator